MSRYHLRIRGTTTHDPATDITRTGTITLEVLKQWQRHTALSRTSGLKGGIRHRDSRTVAATADTLCIDIVLRGCIEVGEENLVRVVNNRINQIVINRLLLFRQQLICYQEAIGVLIALPADDSHILAHAIHREGLDRTAARNQLDRDLGYIRIIGHTEIREEHDVASQIAHVVALIMLEADAIRIPTGMAEVERIDGHEGVQVRRVCHYTHDNLAIIGSCAIAASPEINLILADRIDIQFRHDSIRAHSA